MEWIFQIPLLFFSVVIHEVAHGLAARWKGDTTAQDAGRLTLNPLPHIDPVGTLVLPISCYVLGLPMFAWAAPVPVNPGRLRNPRLDPVWVALVGPLSNVALALGAGVALRLATLVPFWSADFQGVVYSALQFTVTINLFLAFFNLIPVHPLDGSKVLGGVLPSSIRTRYEALAPYGIFIIVALMMTHLLGPLIVTPTRIALRLLTRMGLLW